MTVQLLFWNKTTCTMHKCIAVAQKGCHPFVFWGSERFWALRPNGFILQEMIKTKRKGLFLALKWHKVSRSWPRCLRGCSRPWWESRQHALWQQYINSKMISTSTWGSQMCPARPSRSCRRRRPPSPRAPPLPSYCRYPRSWTLSPRPEILFSFFKPWILQRQPDQLVCFLVEKISPSVVVSPGK